ncbi:RNA polymerase sigma factor [Paenibacillus sp. YN15]|uniref:RNA polymerase sigma factor n=1 Tax=Paenibacillus sp. YN15 TaxID=1742774 RepID=UPI000DCE8130|nr:sigma-70 family RNA polymerase sigma factor [Paenibacillus sp. YN15]RAV02652.1 sigma-70 family RNA polymerase sigma factor [Paenibacillus sp. YN15]
MSLLFLSACENDDDKIYMTDLYERYYPLMKKKACSIVQDYEVVDDLIQEAFLKLIPKISLLRSLSCYKTTSYIVNTIKHVAIDHIRKKARLSNHVYTGLDDDLAEQIPDFQAATEENYMKTEECEALEKAMFQLSERDRTLLYFKYNMEMGDQQIGDLLNIPTRHVRQYVARARHRALHILSEKGEYHV